MTDEPLSPPDTAPLFPLPDVVLFPRQVLPLHIFEPRYRVMTADALEGHKHIAVALLRPGFEQAYFTKHAPVHSVVGVGRIVAHEMAADGCYNILLRGEARATVVNELSGRPYRVAQLDIMHSYCSAPRSEVAELRRSLREALAASGWPPNAIREHLLDALRAPVPLGDVTDVICGCLPIDASLRQDLLAEPNAFTRATRLLEHLATLRAIAQAGCLASRQEQVNFN